MYRLPFLDLYVINIYIEEEILSRSWNILNLAKNWAYEMLLLLSLR